MKALRRPSTPDLLRRRVKASSTYNEYGDTATYDGSLEDNDGSGRHDDSTPLTQYDCLRQYHDVLNVDNEIEYTSVIDEHSKDKRSKIAKDQFWTKRNVNGSKRLYATAKKEESEERELNTTSQSARPGGLSKVKKEPVWKRRLYLGRRSPSKQMEPKSQVSEKSERDVSEKNDLEYSESDTNGSESQSDPETMENPPSETVRWVMAIEEERSAIRSVVTSPGKESKKALLNPFTFRSTSKRGTSRQNRSKTTKIGEVQDLDDSEEDLSTIFRRQDSLDSALNSDGLDELEYKQEVQKLESDSQTADVSAVLNTTIDMEESEKASKLSQDTETTKDTVYREKAKNVKAMVSGLARYLSKRTAAKETTPKEKQNQSDNVKAKYEANPKPKKDQKAKVAIKRPPFMQHVSSISREVVSVESASSTDISTDSSSYDSEYDDSYDSDELTVRDEGCDVPFVLDFRLFFLFCRAPCQALLG